MPYPIIGKAEARSYLIALEAAEADGTEPPSAPEARLNPDGPDEDWETFAEEIAARLDTLATATGKSGDVAGNQFEIAAGPVVHEILPEHPALADPEFWIWLIVRHGVGIVRWRYPNKGNLKNFGIGGSGENLLYRIWLRAEIAHAPGNADAYELAKVGDIDFWRSHIFRQGYGEVRHFVRALIEFQFPIANCRKSRLKIEEIRALAKRLKRARSNLMFELMSQDRAATFIESEWQRLKSEAT